MLFTTSHHVALDLHEALTRYRVRLMDFSRVYQLDSIRI